MDKKPLKNYLYQKRNIIKQSASPLKLEDGQKEHIRIFLRKNKKLFKLAIIFSATAVFLQVFIPLITNFYIKKYSFFLEINKLFFSLFFLLFILGFYLLFSFLSIKYEKTLTIYFLNYLRRKWFSFYLNKSIFSLKNKDKSKIITKISYHFSLLQMGITNSFFPAFQGLFLMVGLLLSSFFISTTLLFILLIMLPVNLLVFFLGYIIAKYYVSQDQTLYSKILVFISDTLNEFNLTKLNKREKKSLNYLDEMVDIDSYFRIQRELWIKYGNKIIFAIVVFLGAAIYLVEIYHPFLKVESSMQYLVYGIFFGLIIRLVYLSLRIGLFSFPLKLGMILCIPKEIFSLKRVSNLKQKILNISFKAKKAKLNLNQDYIKDLKYDFKSGERILIFGPENSGKSFLGIVFSGHAPQGISKPWIVKVNDKRFLYKKWQEFFIMSTYLIHPNFQSEENVLNILMGRGFFDVSKLDFKDIFQVLNKYPVFNFITGYNKSIGQKVDKLNFSLIDRAIIQMAYALLNPPSILVIDNLWLDLDSTRIKEAISVLDKELKDTIIIFFSTKDNNILDYDQKYHLGN